ncbi:uncharacterized protein LOC113276382 [Papaver somniferum]|uniref:uncharacterized protein LOC113276382 n=1 Tax=Papaver somniferum TaxID=3469 RepID=UPI000E6F7768|nr:uncharacterized protein LOC113276382 [Papaver somniferum]
MFVIPNELNVESNMFSPSYATDIEHEPNLEVNDWTRDTMIINRASHVCYDDDDVMLEVNVYAENIVEPLGSEILGFSASTFMNDISSSIPYICDVDTDLEPVHCEDERDLGKVQLSVDTNDRMHETIIDVSDSLPRSQYDVSFELPMHEIKVLNDADDTELGLDDLLCENEYDMPVSDLGRECDGTNGLVHKNNLNVPTSLSKSQTETLSPNLDLICNKIVKTTFLRIPNLGLELCASKVLLDYFPAKYDTFEEPRLECLSLPIPNKVHFE